MTTDSGQSGSRFPTASALCGQTIGDFEILEEIGRGGMGVVFRARQKSLDRMVAFKILSGHLGLSEHAVARFRREAQATAKLHHPNIVPIFAQGQEDGTYYYVMELVSGKSLHDIIADLRVGGTSPPSDRDVEPKSGSGRRHAPREAGAADEDLALAETRLLNRGRESDAPSVAPPADRPFVDPMEQRPDRSCFEVYTADYFDHIVRQTAAVADALDYAHRNGVIHRDIKPHNLLLGDGDRLCLSDFGLARILAQPGVTVTGEFIGSPLYMAPEQITGRGKVAQASDIYSLGATMYEWLTLRPPFPGHTREQVISSIITADVIFPRSMNSRIPLDVETICLKAIEKDPAHRYQSAADMRDDLRRFLGRANIRARRAGLVASTLKVVSKRRLAATVIAAAVLIGALSLQLFRELRQSRVREAEIASREDQVEAVIEENIRLQEERGQLSQLMEQNLQLGRSFVSAIREDGVLAGLLSTESGDDEGVSYTPVNTAQRIGAMYLSAMRESATRALRNTDPDSVAPNSAEEYYLRALAEGSADEALAHIGQCLAANPDYAQARLLRAWINCQSSRSDAMLADAEEMLAIDPQFGKAFLVRAAANLLEGSHEAALADLSVAAQSLRHDYRHDVLKGLALAGIGRNDAAIVAMSPALITNPDCVLALLGRANLSLAGARYLAAIVDLTRVLELEQNNAEAFERRGECYDRLKRFDEAFNDFLRAQQISGRSSLYVKIALAAANRDEQRIARETEEAKQRERDSRDSQPPSKVLPPPENPTAVEEWLRNFLDRRDSGERRQSLRTLPMRFQFARW